MKKVLLIGLDGATFKVLDRLMAEGVMPFMAKLQERGARGPLASVVPPLTPPAWTSLMTGRSPGHHGVFDFFRLESVESRHIRFSTSHDVANETIWERASRHGVRTSVLNFPLTFPPPRIDGVVVPGWVPWRQLRLACWPETLFDKLKAIPGFEPRTLAMDMSEEEQATEGCDDTKLEDWVDLHIQRERGWFQVLTHLMKEDPCPLTAVIFDGTDRIQHLCWRFLDTDGSDLKTDLERRIRARTLDYFREVDGMLEQLISGADSETTTIIASDHGFGPTQAIFHVNSWLAEKGYLTWRDEAFSQSDDAAVLGVGKVARHTFEIDWDKTKAFAITPTSNALYIVRQEHGAAGVAPEGYEAFRERLAEELKELTDPATGQQIVTRTWTREEAFSGPAMERAPDLTLELFDGGLVSILPSEQILSQRPAVAGSHRPDGVFMAAGPGISGGARLDSVSILDIAPLVLHRLGLDIPEDMEGTVPQAIFEPGELERCPVVIGAAGQQDVRASAPVPRPMDEKDQALMMERLRQLGYVE